VRGDNQSSAAGQPAEIPSARRIVTASVVALFVAAALLVTAVLPAEYGLDPLGTGRLLGLTALSNAGGAMSPESSAYRSDAMTFVLGPYQSVEYKYRLESGSSMIFAWESTRAVRYDFHAEPDGAAEGYAESFDMAEGARRAGRYTAPFPGIHGWYWENLGGGDATITLRTSGFYSRAIEFSESGQRPRELAPPAWTDGSK
jgi:hypothetical protein